MVKRRALQVGLPGEICNHSFRGTGITEYLRNGGELEKAARIAGHESTRTTQLYNRTDDELTLDEIERILKDVRKWPFSGYTLSILHCWNVPRPS